MDSRGLDIDELCKRHDSPDIDRVMQHWQSTHSPMVYWTRQTVQKIQKHETNKDDDLLREVINKDYIYGMPFKYGLPKMEVEKVCRQMYQKDVVKLTLQITDPKTTRIHQYLTTTAGEMLGVIGKYTNLNFSLKTLGTEQHFIVAGGTIGLFLGASIVSLVEACFYVYKVQKNNMFYLFMASLSSHNVLQ